MQISKNRGTKKRWFVSALSLAVVIALSTDRAEAQAPEDGQVTATPNPADPVWESYHQAQSDLIAGRVEKARAALLLIAHNDPTHPAAVNANVLLDLIAEMKKQESARPPPALLVPPKPTLFLGPGPEVGPDQRATVSVQPEDVDLGKLLRDERPTGLARAEAVTGQTIHGLTLGIEMISLAKIEDSRAVVGLLMLGAGAGLGSSLYFTRDGITSGHAAALNSGTEWGFFNGLMLSIATKPNEYGAASGQTTAGMLMAGQVLGLGIGELGWQLTGASSGDVSLMSSGGLWTTAVTMLTFVAADTKRSDRALATTALIASDLGLVGGAVIAHYYPVSRGHALLMDLGGGAGLLLGAGLVVLAGGDNSDGRAVAGAAAVGTLLGLGVTAYFTRNWDLPDVPPIQIGVAPTQGGAQLLAAVQF